MPLAALLGATAVCGWAGAEPAVPSTTLREVVEKAIVTNPESLTQFQALQSALEGQNISRGALRPEVQLQAQTGHEWRGDTPGAPPADWHRNAYSLQLTQLLYDGWTSASSVRRRVKPATLALCT